MGKAYSWHAGGEDTDAAFGGAEDLYGNVIPCRDINFVISGFGKMD